MTTDPTDKHQEEARELLPCPFCGSSSVVWSENFGRVRCNSCFIGTVTVQPDLRVKGDALKRRCVKAWNTRALSSRDTEIRAVLEGLMTASLNSIPHWCQPNTGCSAACLAARRLWERVKG